LGPSLEPSCCQLFAVVGRKKLTSVGSIMSLVPATVASYWNGPSHLRGFQISLNRSLKYWFENRVGFTTQGLYISFITLSGVTELTHQTHSYRRDIDPYYELQKARQSPGPRIPSVQRYLECDQHQVLHLVICSLAIFTHSMIELTDHRHAHDVQQLLRRYYSPCVRVAKGSWVLPSLQPL
jgi:hypothetical protein